jgi:ABC-type multidrug transport system fused ATPase/permease subunit
VHEVRLDDFVEAQSEGLHTVVGEKGVRMSGGQRQRIGIARALYRDPSLLVLDEATSALDAATESAVMDTVLSLKGSRTIVAIAHRTTTLAACDRIIHFSNGKVLADGVPGVVYGEERK